MELTRKSFDMPALHTTMDDFGLSYPETNRSRATRLLANTCSTRMIAASLAPG